MASVNRAIILGNLGRDPELRYMTSGEPICNLSIATTTHKKGRDGAKSEETEWHRVVLFGRTAEVAAEYARKGSTVYVEGRIRTRNWQDKDGVEKYSTEIVGDSLQLIGGKQEKKEPVFSEIDDQSIPF